MAMRPQLLVAQMSRRRHAARRRTLLYDKLSIAAVVLSVGFGSWVALLP
jgi:AraC-like DNA-binding protein